MRPIILCIDDHEQGLFARKMVLQSQGYSVLTTTNGLRGLELLRGNNVAAVVLDYQMQGSDGGDLACAMKAEKPEVPIIMLSGYSELPKRAVKLVDAVLQKGKMMGELFATLRRLILRE